MALHQISQPTTTVEFRGGQLVAVQRIEAPLGQCADILRSICESGTIAIPLESGTLKTLNGNLTHDTYGVKIGQRNYFVSIIRDFRCICNVSLNAEGKYIIGGNMEAAWNGAIEVSMAPDEKLLFISGPNTSRKIHALRMSEEHKKVMPFRANLPNVYDDDVVCFGDDNKSMKVDKITEHFRSLRALVATPFGTDIPSYGIVNVATASDYVQWEFKETSNRKLGAVNQSLAENIVESLRGIPNGPL